MVDFFIFGEVLMADKQAMDKFIPQEIEPRWHAEWERSGLYATHEDDTRQKYYFLTMLPYPSGDLHIGHWYAMTPSDAAARFQRMRGHNVFFPIGFDAFGLPAENAAIKHGTHPYTWTMGNIERMRGQLRSMGAMWAWDHEAVSCDPRYYAWTQWFFRKLYDMGLAYRKYSPVDFCPTCNTTLAREQVWGDDRHCERCGTPVIKKELEQWYFKITDYADQLLNFDGIDWPERIRVMQTNWIGRSQGAEVTFKSEQGDDIVVFTTRPDTLWGATFMVLAPEHPLVDKLTPTEQRAEVEAYQYQAGRQTEIERTSTDKQKTGVFTGAYAVNPVNGKRIPIWIADYVLMTYGTGAIMAVPAHDERDFAFALQFGLPIVPVVARNDGLAKSVVMPHSMRPGLADALTSRGIEFTAGPLGDRGEALYVTLRGPAQIDFYVEQARAHILPGNWCDVVGSGWIWVFEDGVQVFDSVEAGEAILRRCQAIEPAVRTDKTLMGMLNNLSFYRDVLSHADHGALINSGPFTGVPGDTATHDVIAWLEKAGIGKGAVNYRLRDWLISRQRYWGAPIPMIYCPHCGIVPVPYEDLPVRLPIDAEIPPTGENALKFRDDFRYVKCPQCGADAERETDTMDTFMCSSWYQYAYVTPYYKAGQTLGPSDTPFDPQEGAYWLPVDQYTGGPEHATMHLLYTRFFTKAMHDMGLVTFDEPMTKLYNQGIILGPDGNRMSKSRGNVVAPDEWVSKYGADAVRAYLMFIGPWSMGGPWNFQGIEGVSRFLERVWTCVVDAPSGRASAATAGADDAAAATRELRHMTHRTLQKVTEDYESFKFNTMVAALMEFNNYLLKAKETAAYSTPAWDEAIDALVLMMAPAMPHMSEELWQRRHGQGEYVAAHSVHVQPWPAWDPELAKAETVTLVVQVNGKLRDKVEAAADVTETEARALALASPAVQRWLEGKTIVKVIFAGGKLINIVVR
jgi:leucyl-tRNA synthetase